MRVRLLYAILAHAWRRGPGRARAVPDAVRFDCAERRTKPVACPPRAKTLEVDRPIRWLHVPKCGTSFVDTVLPLACEGLPPWASVDRVEIRVASKPHLVRGSNIDRRVERVALFLVAAAPPRLPRGYSEAGGCGDVRLSSAQVREAPA